jgi:hypothetical protein
MQPCGGLSLLLCVCLAALCVHGPVASATYHVAKDAKDVGDNRPLATIGQAIERANPGDTVLVYDGRYSEQVILDKARIRLVAAQGHRPIIDGGGVEEFGIILPRDVSVDGCLVQGLEIANQTGKGILIHDRKSRSVVIRNNIVHHAWERGIDVYGSEHRIEGNVIYMIGNAQEAMGIRLADAENCLVRDNDVFLCKKTAIRDQSGKGNVIQGNLMHECWTGLDYNNCSGAKAFNNYLYDNCQGFNPKHVKGHSGWNLFWHNTLYGNHGPHISIAVNVASNYSGEGLDFDYLDIRNNILVKSGATHLWSKPDIIGEHLVIDNNLYHGLAGWPPYYYHTEWPRGGRPGLISLDEMRAQTPFGSAGRAVDPQLRDPEQGDLDYPDTSPGAEGGAELESPFGNQLGARGLRKPVTRFIRVLLKAIAASTNEAMMANTTDGRYCTGWHSGEETENQWITYEVQGRDPFTHIILTPVGHQVEYNPRNYEFAVSDDNERWDLLLKGENNDSGSVFIYELDEPIAPRYLKFRMIDKFPDDGRDWSLNRLEFDELSVGFCSPSLDQLAIR